MIAFSNQQSEFLNFNGREKGFWPYTCKIVESQHFRIQDIGLSLTGSGKLGINHNFQGF